MSEALLSLQYAPALEPGQDLTQMLNAREAVLLRCSSRLDGRAEHGGVPEAMPLRAETLRR